MHSSVLRYRFLLENLIKIPKVFRVINERIYVYNPVEGSRHYLTPVNCHYVRHGLYAIAAATTRFNETFDEKGERIPFAKLPVGFHDVRLIDSLPEAQLLALRRYSENYNPDDSWPNCTISLRPSHETC